MSTPSTVRNRLLALIAFLLSVAALKLSYSVSMPIAAAVFIIAAAWPIKPALDRVLPSSLSYVGTMLCLLLIITLFMAGLYFATSQVVHTFVLREAELRSLYATYSAWAENHGLLVFDGDMGYQRLIELAQLVASKIYSFLGYIGFIGVLVVLGLPEVSALRRKVRERLEAGDRRDLIESAEAIADKVRAYVGVTTFTSLVTGVASALWAYAVGLDLALTWGILNFLLNYIPVAGNIIGILPPTLYAIVQFREWTMPLVVFAGYAVLQIAISNFLYPWLQGRGLALSPLAIVISLAFWGWVWGIPGALLAVPLTAAAVIVCDRFPGTQWIAKLVSSERG